MPNPQIGGQFAPKVTFVGEVQASAAQPSAKDGAEREFTFKPRVNRNVPDFGRMHAQLARQLAANKEARKFQQVSMAPAPFSFMRRPNSAAKEPNLTPADIAAMARDGGVRQVATGRWESFTQVTWEDGSRYAGEVQDGLPHGHGAWTSPVGSSYRGGWSRGVFHGQGAYAWRSGDRYTGTYCNGAAEGKGTLSLANGDVYEGSFVAGLPHGTGTWLYANRNTYQGEFANGQAHGRGIFVAPGDGDAGTSYRYEGQYDRDEPHGQGTISWSDGSKFVGTFQRGAQTGPGELTTLKGDSIKGSWLNGQANGSLRLTMAGGDVFEGQFENGVAHGNGSYVFACGDMWQGEWREGFPWKVGTLTCPLLASSQSQPAIWAAIGARALRADASIQPLSPNFVFQRTTETAESASRRGITFPLKTPSLPLSGDSSMMAIEKQRPAFTSRPERRDLAAILIAGASQASLVDRTAVDRQNSARSHRQRSSINPNDSNLEERIPFQPAGSESLSKTKAKLKGKSEQRFRSLAAASNSGLEPDLQSAPSLPRSEIPRDKLRAADAAHTRLLVSAEAFAFNPNSQSSAASFHREPPAIKRPPSNASKNDRRRDIIEAWV